MLRGAVIDRLNASQARINLRRPGMVGAIGRGHPGGVRSAAGGCGHHRDELARSALSRRNGDERDRAESKSDRASRGRSASATASTRLPTPATKPPPRCRSALPGTELIRSGKRRRNRRLVCDRGAALLAQRPCFAALPGYWSRASSCPTLTTSPRPARRRLLHPRSRRRPSAARDRPCAGTCRRAPAAPPADATCRPRRSCRRSPGRRGSRRRCRIRRRRRPRSAGCDSTRSNFLRSALISASASGARFFSSRK